MEILDRIPVSFDVFIRSVIAKFAKNNKLPATAVSEMRCAKVCQELFAKLGGSDMAMEYIHSVLGRMPANMRAKVKISEKLADFMGLRIRPEIIRKYRLTPDELFVNWNFDCLADVSTLENLDLGASVECEHHERWKKAQETERKAAEPEITAEAPQESPGELDSLLAL